MTPSELAHALHSGETVFGTLIVSPSPRWPDVVRTMGLDFVFIDTEHIAIDRHELSWMCQTYAALGLNPIVRIPSPDPYAACMVLDGGAAGIVAPYVETVEQVKALRGAVKLRPLKGQKLSGILNGKNEGDTIHKYMDNAARNRLLIINIESTPAIEALDDLLSVPGVDAVLIGPHDLSCNLGIPEQYDNPVFLEACETIFRKARQRNIGAGIHFWGSAEEHARLISLGANLMIQSGDIMLFQKYLPREIAAVRQAVGLAQDASEGDKVII